MNLAGSFLQSALMAAHPLPGGAGRKRLLRLLRRVSASPFLFRGKYGIHYLLRNGNYIDDRIARDGIYEAASVQALLDEVARRRPDLFLDIGANLGVYSLAVAQQGICHNIIAFEPDPYNRAQLCANLFLNGFEERIRVLAEAVSDRGGEAVMHAFRDAGGPSTGRSSLESEGVLGREHMRPLPVRRVRLDDLFPDLTGRSIMLKMDIEGHEPAALAGMRGVIGRNRVWLQVELLPHFAARTRGILAELGLAEQPQAAPGTTDFIFTSP